MNLLLFETQELQTGGRISLGGRRAQHLLEVLRVKPGDSVRVGELDGGCGTATVATVSAGEVGLELQHLGERAEAAAPTTLIAALPRPQSLKKLLESSASLGVSEIILINSDRVEQSYFSSPVLRPEKLREHLLLGLEQARSTVLPRVTLLRDFSPTLRGVPHIASNDFIRAAISSAALCGVADGGALESLVQVWDRTAPGVNGGCVFAIGPEGGWREYEIEFWRGLGLSPFSLGKSVLRVEVAVTVLLGQVGLLREIGAKK